MSWQSSSGLSSWLLQRLSAVYITLFLVAFAFAWGGKPFTFEIWHSWVAHPVVNIAIILFIFALLMHAWVGIRDVIMDYVKPVSMRYLLFICFGLTFISLGLWTLRTLLLVI